MAKLLNSATMSLDSFIVGPGGDASWMTPYLGPNPAIDDVMSGIGALLVGHRTFRGDDPDRSTDREGKPFGGGWSGPQIVLTHLAPDVSMPTGQRQPSDRATAYPVSYPGEGCERTAL